MKIGVTVISPSAPALAAAIVALAGAGIALLIRRTAGHDQLVEAA